jgi:hypothetical protein
MKDLTLTELDAKPDAIGFFEGICLEGLEEKWLRISAAVQRKFFGKVIFGKKAVKVMKDGLIKTYQTMAFGHDWDEQFYRFDHFRGCLCYASDFRVVQQ